MGGSYLWVNKDAEVYSSTPTGPGTSKAKFLQGPIATAGFGITTNFNRESTQVCPGQLDTLACPHQVGVAGLRQAAIAQPQLQVPITSPARGCHATFPEPMCRPTYTPMDCPPTYLVGCVRGAEPFAAAAPAAIVANPAVPFANPDPVTVQFYPSMVRACGTSNVACLYHPTINAACFVATGAACYLPPWTAPETINQTPVGQVQQFAAAAQPQAAMAPQLAAQPQIKPPPTLICTYGPPQCPPTYYYCSTQYPRCGF